MLELQYLTLFRNHRKICSNLSVKIPRGEVVLITGEHGSGKTSLIECLLGKLKPTGGQVLLDEHDLHSLTKDDRKHFLNSTGIAGHETALRPYDSLRQSLSRPGVREDELVQMLAFLSMENRVNDLVKELSHAERRALDFARSLLGHPRLIIWDEPLMGLSEGWKEKFKRALKDFKNSGATIIIATIDPTGFESLGVDQRMEL